MITHQLHEEIGYHDHNLFHQPIEECLQLSEKQKMTWIDQTTKAIKVSMDDYRNKQTQGQKDI